MKAGETITQDHIRSIRPGFGLKPKHYDAVIGQRVARDITRGTPMTWDALSSLKESA
jgi:N-acetylneuraminate synthase